MLLNYVCYYLEIRKKQLYANKKNKVNKEKKRKQKTIYDCVKAISEVKKMKF